MSTDQASLTALAECPICTEVPRDGVMLMCVRGHNICFPCKTKLGHDALCPIARCGYSNPPARNWTVRDLIDTILSDIPCKFANSASGDSLKCVFKGTRTQLETHEAICEQRLVPCPDCTKMISLSKLIDHGTWTHEAVVSEKMSSCDKMTVGLLWKSKYNAGCKAFSWPARAEKLRSGWMYASFRFVRGQVYIWLQLLASSAEAEKLKCRIEFGNDDDKMSWTAPVFPIDWIDAKIMSDDGCSRLSNWSIRKLLTEEGLTENSKDTDYTARLCITFHVMEK